MRWMLGALVLGGCAGGDEGTDTGTTPGTLAPPSTWDFAGRNGEASSVSYSGQSLRHLLISDLEGWMGSLTARLDQGTWFPVAGEVEAGLEFYFVFDSSTSGALPHGYAADPPPLQQTYDDVATDKDLVGKLAGNDPVGQHRDWSVDFVGWDEPGVTTPESLLRSWFAEIDAAAVARAAGTVPLGADGAPVAAVTLTADGRDLSELTQKLLLGAVAYSQGTDDYLDDDTPGSGLLSSNAVTDEPYTELEHAWDEGFGYFGAPRDQAAWSVATLAEAGAADTWTPDGALDLTGEVAWGHARYAGKRDAGAVAPTDFSGEAWDAFLAGRTLIASVDGELDDAQLDELRGHRDRAVAAWEGALVASAVHYANDLLQDLSKVGTDDYRFADQAQHWSELKGFALALQFNPRSCVDADDQDELHGLIGIRPVLPDAGAAALADHREDLVRVKQLLADACGVDPSNLGDDDGLGGW